MRDPGVCISNAAFMLQIRLQNLHVSNECPRVQSQLQSSHSYTAVTATLQSQLQSSHSYIALPSSKAFIHELSDPIFACKLTKHLSLVCVCVHPILELKDRARRVLQLQLMQRR